MTTDGSEKLPWEWQLDRDDALHLEEYYRAVDALIRYLNKKQLKEWTETASYKLSQTLIIRNGEAFDNYFPIDRSERMYLMLAPFIREAQMLTVKHAYGSGWDELLQEKDVPETEAHFAACKSCGTAGHEYGITSVVTECHSWRGDPQVYDGERNGRE